MEGTSSGQDYHPAVPVFSRRRPSVLDFMWAVLSGGISPTAQDEPRKKTQGSAKPLAHEAATQE